MKGKDSDRCNYIILLITNREENSAREHENWLKGPYTSRNALNTSITASVPTLNQNEDIYG